MPTARDAVNCLPIRAAIKSTPEKNQLQRVLYFCSAITVPVMSDLAKIVLKTCQKCSVPSENQRRLKNCK